MANPQRPADGDEPLTWSERAVFRETYAEDWQDLCVFLRARFGRGPPDPEDVAQQAFVKLGERPADQEHENPRGFVFRVAINLARNALRRQLRAYHLVSASAPALEPDAEPDAERALIAKQELDLLKGVVRAMPPRHRRFLTANRVAGLSFAEIARQNAVSEALVRKTVAEAVAACQRALDGDPIDFRGLSRERHRRP
ncbi:sigma-70 family RNA polymerase sigma factor [Caulobacter sp. SL161]|uniref:RNA polymerase sigma factor n=1 Tax=Caulobacter sp. SL161 TaxID=2995156 RepID=UPI002275A6CB|nr:sigma-70 family RNA polymerase sigma factor [Caulobacter sp. SL161]MCY1646625.1 sigma-70 family RNA polymerase sigma factor [Caulobacter sp. SL161]